MNETAKIISMIRAGKAEREKAIRLLYSDRKLINGVKKILGKSAIGKEDFTDIFNHMLVQFMKKVLENQDFEVRTNLHSYLFGMARNLWMMKLRSQKTKKEDSLEDNFDLHSKDISIDLQIINDERKKHLNILMDKIGERCKELLMLWASNFKMNEIAKRLDFASEGSVRKKKFDCMKSLNKMLLANPQLKAMIK